MSHYFPNDFLVNTIYMFDKFYETPMKLIAVADVEQYDESNYVRPSRTRNILSKMTAKV